MVKTKKVPLRKSVVSNAQFPKKELLRIVCNKAGEISIDPQVKHLVVVLISRLKMMKPYKPNKGAYLIAYFRQRLQIIFMMS